MKDSIRLGILSDTHGDVERTARVMRSLRRLGVDEILHCGDIGSTRVLDVLVEVNEGWEIPITCVLGNVDAWDRTIGAYPRIGRVYVAGRFVEREIGGLRMAMLHGDDDRRWHEAVASGRYNVIFYGHTHVRADDMTGATRCINPGAVFRASPPSMATFDVGERALTYYSLDGDKLPG